MAEPTLVNYVITTVDGYSTLLDGLWDNNINPNYRVTYGDDNNTVENFYYNDEASGEYWTFESEASLAKITVNYDTYETILGIPNGQNSVPIKKVEIIYYEVTEDFAGAVKTVIQSMQSA